MKKITGLFILMVAAIAFISCDPVENRIDPANGRTAVTMADIDKYVTVTQQTIEGKASNYFSMNSDGLQALSQFQHGLGTIVGPGTNNQYVQCFVVPGQQSIVFTALNADGTRVSKTFNVNVEECFNVAPEWALFCGTGSKVWSWDDQASSVWGNGGYLGNTSPGWWTIALGSSDLETQVPGEGKGATLTFSAMGSSLVKTRTDGTTQAGTFSFDMSKIKTTDGNAPAADGSNIWAIGQLNTSAVTVLIGIGPNNNKAPIYSYDILKLNENQLVLAWPEPGVGAWGTAWFWMFRAQ